LQYIDDLVLREESNERLYSLADPNWNIVAVCDSTGSVVERMKYDAFGKITWLNNNFGTKNSSDYSWNRAFTGQVFDFETRLMLYRNRYYHVELGRFVNRDPISYNAGDVNLFRMIFNRILNGTDYWGLQFQYEGLGCFGADPYNCQENAYIAAIQQPIPPPKCRKIQNPNKPFETNGCTKVPDKPLGFDFTSSCNKHDICYETCGNSKSLCDKKFFKDMAQECYKYTKSATRKLCLIAANTYYLGVYWAATSAYSDSQEGWCIDDPNDPNCACSKK
jgi:RHS repeat-associated protein